MHVVHVYKLLVGVSTVGVRGKGALAWGGWVGVGRWGYFSGSCISSFSHFDLLQQHRLLAAMTVYKV